MQNHDQLHRWAWVEINTSAVRSNVAAFRKRIATRTKLMAVVKADAYGHGACELAPIMHAAGADQFAVATVDEGVALRKAGIEYPILILSEPPLAAIETILEYHLMPTVYTTEFALALGEAAVAHDMVAPYHMAIDTGMTRIGVRPNDVLEFRRTIDFHRGIECAGTFTHFATADYPDDWDFALAMNRFTQAVSALHDAGFPLGLVHCNNTPATILSPDSQFDMCRVGIGLYGLQPAETTEPYISLTPVMSVKGKITRAVYPEVGDGVSYGLTWRVPRQSIQVATVPIGYADGLSRNLSNKMDVLVQGMRARQVGRICMDQFMFCVDLARPGMRKPVRELEYGDTVTIIGRDGDECITADEMARLLDTINYEVVCDFGLRLQKIFV